ncbi:uncharacterized protein Nmag_1061 [Natrialba magadii ATCC 43099]|uniref:Uncharacterized protein n=1 Tax=Natrialba magadii (strain ATCC 43099 / DSM 3394 / CCM 3739 / CIP 104546 / IAM 13178 / JCM 8861 / NBRC 102185 / NCIMB 2190 / MS3) TaxID=547559 RepID=D3SRE0_NATMM|nr:hypothetical protein [Natrialba magadii]ADD04645.1 uncharacterized protein Nmag_1061 [Natrialba magadii ATCC 43099]ELY25300.1 hypothetical protein C500_17821 [Natrialba magadii ATCC 43099]
MAGTHTTSLLELFRATPVTSSLLSLAPLALAVGQLGNSYINGVSPIVSIVFAIGMIGFSVVAMGHHAAEYRLRQLESGARFGGALETEQEPDSKSAQ